jgi:hypothetical protein
MTDLREQIQKEKEKKWMDGRAQSREITKEILRFGVSQDQIIHIIKMLALELEDHAMMQTICRATDIEEELDQTISSKIIQPGGE